MSGPFGASPWGYNPSTDFYDYSINQSLRLDGTSAYLSKNNFGTSTNTSKRTFSTWIKRSTDTAPAAYNHIIGAGTSSIDGFGFANTTERLQWLQGGSVTKNGVRQLRDVSSWYHVFTTWNATDNELYIYVNGELDYSSTGSISALSKLGNTGHTTYIGKRSNVATYIHGYLAETVFLDGYIGSISDFAETVNGVWVPKDISAASLTYGTNGFYLDYADSSDLGKDVSGKGNHFTSNNLAAEDQVPDSPTNNFATYSSIYKNLHQNILSNGNLQNDASSNYFGTGATIAAKSGKWYCELNLKTFGNNNSGVGIDDVGGTLQKEAGYGFGVTAGNYGVALRNDLQTIYNNGSSSQTSVGSWSAGDIVGMALDLDSGTKTLQFYKNGSAYGSAETISTSAPTGEFVFGSFGHNANTHVINFGQDSSFAGNKTSGSANASDGNGIGDFYYTPPSGFLALCTANLTEPAIGPNSGLNEQSDDNFNTVLYTGDGTNGNAITGVGFQPDWLWIKSRSGTAYHELHDSVRGAGTRLFSNETTAESTVGTVSSFDTDGFTVSRNSAYDGTNQNSVTFVGWNWKAGGTAVSNSNGSITSSVSVNTNAGFSIVSYTGTGSNATVGHGLSSAPELVIVKERDGTGQWSVQSTGLSAANKVVHLQSTAAEATKADHFNSTFPTSTVFSVGTSGNTNGNTHPFIAYCFHSVEGYSKIGSYTGNGNANGTFVFTGFRPAWLLIKNTADVTHWALWDSERNTYNVSTTALYPSSSDGDQTGASLYVDFLSNGFKWRANHNSVNGTSDTFIYLAFAEAPFKYANAR